MWVFFSAVLLSVTQMLQVLATGCNIVSVTSPSASSLEIQWRDDNGGSVYLLDLRVVNSTSIAPVVVMPYPPSTQRLIQGLRPGHAYIVTLKVFKFYTVVCNDTRQTWTVPAKSQITYSRAISSTSIIFEWSSVFGAESYTLYVEELFSIPVKKYNHTFTVLSGQTDGLTPSTTYNCYIYASNAAGRGARSNIRTITTLVEPPTGVTLVSTGRNSALVSWDSVYKVLLYQVTVTDDDPSNTPVVRNTSSTFMQINNLEPCSTYTVGVSSVNVFLVPGESSNVTHTTSTINPVTSIEVDYSCNSGTVTVTWDLAFGANLYRATAVDGTGASLNCTSDSNSCHIVMLKCGEKYRVHVTAISDDCESIANTSTLFETVPCAPYHTSTSHDCPSNVILFSWEKTNNTFYYVALGVDNNGQVTECRTQDSSCFFTNNGCGKFYTFTVYAVSSECNSEISQPEFVRTSPCLPTNIKTAAECQSEALITTWDSAAGALAYTIEAQGNTGEIYNCTSSSNSCAVTGVPCGDHLSVWIIASNDNCSTDRVLGEVAQTVPCTPTIVSVSTDCSQDSAEITWTTSVGGIFYSAILQDLDGNSHDCSSLGTQCVVENLRCGRNYTAHIIGTNLKCNSSASDEIAFTTAPCPPDNIEAFRDCDANHALIVWQNHLPTGNYTATIEDQNGVQLTCNSDTVNNCKIPNLPCGKRYNVTVTNNDGSCLSTSTAITMDSVPCGPEDVEADIRCPSGELILTWSIPTPADNYTVTISRGLGQPIYCTSTETQCTSGELICGSTYSATVIAVTGSCQSMPSNEIVVQTLPCPATSVIAESLCAPDPVTVQWTASDSSTSYTAVAVSSAGYSSQCTTNETMCYFHDLMCGEVYNISVAETSENCTGLQGDPVTLYTEPCAPTNVFSQLDCVAHTSDVWWDSDPNAVSYTVTATSPDQTLTCVSSTSNCTLTDLRCDHSYAIFVTATDGSCVSSNSLSIWQAPVPCAPEGVNTAMYCSTNDVMVSWENSSWPLNYSVSATPLSGNMTSTTCQTDTTYCTLTGLQCGQTYNVSVKGCHGDCPGAYSVPLTIMTVPCAPVLLEAMTDCTTNSIGASWNPSLGATFYTATLTGPNGFTETCQTPDTMCYFSNIQCATQYTVNATAHDHYCSSTSVQTTVTTGPCDPANVAAELQCGSNSAAVSWGAGAGATAYTVIANGSQHQISCSSQSTSCQLDELQCGVMYSLIVLADDGQCNSTGGSPTMLMAAPCAPYIETSTQICGANSSSVSWMATADATGYTLHATATSGHSVSCSSVNSFCELMDLECGETYTATIVAKGSQCDSSPGESANITTAPCPPASVSKQYVCANNTALISWSETSGHLSFQAELSGLGYLDSCRTTDTSCVVHNLPCGLELDVTVQAEGAECNSTPSASQSLQTAPCAPENVSAALICSNHSALVSWVGSHTAVEYTVTSTGQDAHTHQCHSNTTSCQLSHIHCGETYNIVVTPHSESCPGRPSQVHSFRAGLCPPSNVTTSPPCANSSTVSWSNVAGAEMYIATATADDGHVHNCSSGVSTSCQFTDLHCGESYSVTVVTVDRGCWSEPSSAVEMITGLCPPTNLAGEVACDTNAVTISWDQIQLPGVSYILKYEKLYGTLPPSTLTASSAWHTLTDLQCGERYAFYIAFLDQACQSSYSPPLELSTAPCQPTNFAARVDCGMNRGNFSWFESSGATFYTVEVTGDHGHVASCSSNDTSCAVRLHCGRSYSASLVASTESCNSTQHADIYFDSAPCLPENVEGVMNCYTNVMDVSWSETPGSDNYTAWAISLEGHRASCNSTYNNCSIRDLQCGHVYEVVVTSSSVHCEIIAGSDYKVQAAPCKPENITGDLNCSANIMRVTWDHVSSQVQNFTVEATSASGVNSTIETDEGNCSFLDLSCGQLYTFTVTGHTNVCMSEMSYPTEILTGPCPPSQLSAEMNCATRIAWVSWDTAAAASAYIAQATSTNGHNSSCSAMGSTCELSNLVCGQNYSVIVESMHTGCAGPATSPVWLTTDPCIPVIVSINYILSDAQVTWQVADGASSYSVWAVNDQGEAAKCNSAGTNCHLKALQCSQIYNVTVTAQNQACDSVTSDTWQLKTEPCPPTNIQADALCDQSTATISWDLSALAVGYIAYIHEQFGPYNYTCEADETTNSCVVSGLMCGTQHDVWVTALGEEHVSNDSTVVTVTTGPCQLSGIEAIMDCEIKSATVSWLPGNGVALYAAQLTASSGHTARCKTVQTYCLLTTLQCGEEYSVGVTSVVGPCKNITIMSGYLATEPCTPTNISIHYNMSEALITWGAARGAGSYWVQAVTYQGSTATCNSTGTQCNVTGLECSQIYNVTVAAKNNACNNTAMSEMYQFVTAPCPPTNVQVEVDCTQHTVAVSWEPSELAVGYIAYVYDYYGYTFTCETADTNTGCVVSGLMCGGHYYALAVAFGEEYNSSESDMVSFYSAPCLPTSVEVEVDCYSNGVAAASWIAPLGNASISLTASGSFQVHCQAKDNLCNLEGLACGETYQLSLTASNSQCNVTIPMGSNFTTRPCQPQRVGVDLPCGSGTAVLSWEEMPEVELYMGSAVPSSGGMEHWCNSTDSTCDFPGLACGETYNFTVKALSHGCSSQVSDPVYIQTEPCQPMIVLAQPSCQSNVVKLIWLPASDVSLYLITATGNLGYVENFNTTQASLITALPCGQNYSLMVQGRGSSCDSQPSSPAFAKTPPCIPRHVTTLEQCETNTASVIWWASDGAKMYIADAMGQNGDTHLCYSNHTNCTWDDLHCGEEYTVLVMSEDDSCTSLPSNSSVIHMAPCSPENVLASADCDTNLVLLSWDASNGSSVYNVSLETGGQTVSRDTNNTKTYWSDLSCGANYSFTVTPYNPYCLGMRSIPAFIQTWPCPPQGIYATHDCLSGSAKVMWQPNNGMDNYTAILDSHFGLSQTCTSYSGECNVFGLTCGQNLSVSVTASNQQCEVTSVADHTLQSTPCSPTNVFVAKDCPNNTAAVSWSASDGATHYLVTASCYHGNVSHHTSDLNYTLGDLMCGSQYSIQVVAMDDNCSSIPSQAVVFDSAPCPPENVTTQLSCMSNHLTVSWDSMEYADYYLVWVNEDNGGGVGDTFNTTSKEYSSSYLNCGSSYAVQVTAVKGDCQTQSTLNHGILTAPCQPQGIQGSLDCVTNSAWISWNPSLGADRYTVFALGEDDSEANCTSWSNSTCEVEDLACGILYNFSVIAKNSECESSPSTTIELQTAPCSLSAIMAIPKCDSGTILVQWEIMEGGEGSTIYTATAEGSDHTYLSCNNTGTECTLQWARCDLHYTIIVSASSDHCSGLRSPPYKISMEPCPPREVNVSASCEEHSALVSWTPSPVATTYRVVATAADGHAHSCDGPYANCSLSGLHCDEQYAVHVTASHENCTGQASHNLTFSTGPCQPEGLWVTFHCNNQSAVLSWTPSDNAVDYYGCAQAGSGEMFYCHSTSPTCTISDLDCGTLYNFTVQASDGDCNSSFSEPVEQGAAPCPPDTLEVQPMAMYMEVQILQFTWTEINCADTEYLLRLSGNLLGDSQAQFEVSSYWTDRTEFEIPLPCGSYYAATVASRNVAGISNQTVPLTDTTAPCKPSSASYSMDGSMATISWSSSVFATTYAVYRHNISASSRLCTTSGLSCSLLLNATFSDLLVTASNAAGESQGSTVTDVVGHQVRKRDVSENGEPCAPRLNITLVAPWTIMANWTQVGNYTNYKLLIRQLRDNSESTQELTVLGQSIILTDLSRDCFICITVAGENDADVGLESDPVCLETEQSH